MKHRHRVEQIIIRYRYSRIFTSSDEHVRVGLIILYQLFLVECTVVYSGTL